MTILVLGSFYFTPCCSRAAGYILPMHFIYFELNVHFIFSLETLNLGDNFLETIPAEFGSLKSLVSLNLAGNRLRTLPKTLIHLRKLRSLSLHNNRLATLPPEIVSINLVELSLRNNPLVVRFIQSMTYEVPSLMELSGRAIKLAHIRYNPGDLPVVLDQYLNSANKCVNPRCKGKNVSLFAYVYIQ